MAMRGGSAGWSSAVTWVRKPASASPGTGGAAGTEPSASTMRLARRVRPSTSTRSGPASRAGESSTSTPIARKRSGSSCRATRSRADRIQETASGQGDEGRGTGDGARHALADRAGIQLGHAHDFGGGAGEEDLVRGVEVVAVEGQLLDGVVRVAGQLDDRVARDALEDPDVGGGGPDGAVHHDEEVHPARLRHVPAGIEHEHLVHARRHPLDLGEDVREVIERLDARREALAVPDRRRGGEGGEPLVVAVGGPQMDLVHDEDDGRLGALARIEPQVAGAARDDEADVGVLEAALPHRLLDEAAHRVLGHRDLEPDALGRGIEAVEVLLQTEHAALVGADAFEHAVAVQEPVVVDRDRGARAVAVLSVDPDGGWHGRANIIRGGVTARLRTNATVLLPGTGSGWSRGVGKNHPGPVVLSL